MVETHIIISSAPWKAGHFSHHCTYVNWLLSAALAISAISCCSLSAPLHTRFIYFFIVPLLRWHIRTHIKGPNSSGLFKLKLLGSSIACWLF